jgi:hypothetical protein
MDSFYVKIFYFFDSTPKQFRIKFLFPGAFLLRIPCTSPQFVATYYTFRCKAPKRRSGKENLNWKTVVQLICYLSTEFTFGSLSDVLLRKQSTFTSQKMNNAPVKVHPRAHATRLSNTTKPIY